MLPTSYYSSTSLGTIKKNFKPRWPTTAIGRYAIWVAISGSSPYDPVGSVWVDADGHMTLYLPTNLDMAHRFYLYATYVPYAPYNQI